MKKIKHILFGSKQSKQNQQVKADSKNRLSQIGRNMSAGASRMFDSIRSHSAFGNMMLRESGLNRHKGTSGKCTRSKRCKI